MTAEAMFGPYRLESLLGRGGMGEVHLAFDTEQNRTVALKTLAPHLADDEEFQTRFRREAQHVAKLRNPHVIPIHRFGEIDGRLFIDMRYVEGPDLSELIRSDSSGLPPRRAVAFVEQVASALDAAHASGLVHRDVKPANILVDTTVTEFVYLVDFGITRSTTTQRSYSLTRTGELLGSLDYMAPEQFDGDVTSQSDVYGLACVLYEMLTGAKPYSGGGTAALMYAHMNTPPPSVSPRNSALAAFDEVIATGMAKVADQRFGSAGALAAAARAALDQAGGAPHGVVRVPIGTPTVSGFDHVPPTVLPAAVGAKEAADGPAAEPSSQISASAGTATPGQPSRQHPDSSRTGPIHRPPRTPSPPPGRSPAPGGPPGTRPPQPFVNRAEPPPEPRAARRGRPRRVALIVAALALVAVSVPVVLAATWSREPSQPPVAQAPPAASSSAPTPIPSAASGREPGAVRQAIFTGRTDENVPLTIVVGDEQAMAYLCDGNNIEAWLRGEVLPANIVQLDNRAGDELDARLGQEQTEGVITDGGQTHNFTIAVGSNNAGLYEAAGDVNGQDVRIGWVVQSDDSREGIMVRGGEPEEAPELQIGSMMTEVDGVPLVVKRHTGDGAFVGG